MILHKWSEIKANREARRTETNRFSIELLVDHVVDGKEFFYHVITDNATGTTYLSTRCYAPKWNAKEAAHRHVEYLRKNLEPENGT